MKVRTCVWSWWYDTIIKWEVITLMIYWILEYIKISEFWKLVSWKQLSVETKLRSTELFTAATEGGWRCVAAIVSLFIHPYKFFSVLWWLLGNVCSLHNNKQLSCLVFEEVTSVDVRDGAMMLHSSHFISEFDIRRISDKLLTTADVNQ